MDEQTILVVDDTADNIDVMSSILWSEFRVKAARDGERALKIASSSPAPDLILLDIMMPEMDGYEVISRLKSDPSTAHIPVIFVTAEAQAEDEAKGLSLGAVDYITKPVTPDIVLARVRTHLTLHNQQRELEASYENLQRMEELRDSLVHMVVHDMRTPLSVMRTSLSMLKDEIIDDLSEDNRLDLEDALSGSESLIRLVNDLLDVSQMEAGMMPLERRRTNIVAIATEAIERVQKLAQQIDLSIDTEDEMLVECDPRIIDRVISNFLHNALKFTPIGGAITVSASSTDNYVEMSVSDTGPGIAEEHQSHIFDKFAQTKEARQFTSSGLGLTFCRMAIEAHQGKIGLQSEVGAGSRFWFTLPNQGKEVRSDR